LKKSILIAVDLGNAAKVDALIDHASRYDNGNFKIILLNVVEDIPSWAAVELPRNILEKSAQKSAELIIVASHQPELQNYFLGSTAAKVVRHATCSVLVVR
jgi:hypothetical protein